MSRVREPFKEDDLLQRHPPERGQRRKEYVILYSCCCCCCCCLHTLGGVLGAVVAGVTGNYRGHETLLGKNFEPVEYKPTHLLSTQAIYWLSMLGVLFLSVGGLAVYMVTMARSRGIPTERVLEQALFSLPTLGIFLVLFGPVFLLAGVVVTALVIALHPTLRSKSGYWRSLGKIALGVFVGTIGGIIVMVVIGVGLVVLG